MARIVRAGGTDVEGVERPGWRLVGLLACMALVLIACKGVEGVAHLVSATGRGQATIHFEAVCEGTTVTGHLAYHDAPAGVNFRAQAQQHVAGCPTEWPSRGLEGTVTGSYTPQPPNRGPGGTFVLSGKEDGRRGISDVDTFSLTLHGGIYDGYHNEGSWIRGNWKFIGR